MTTTTTTTTTTRPPPPPHHHHQLLFQVKAPFVWPEDIGMVGVGKFLAGDKPVFKKNQPLGPMPSTEVKKSLVLTCMQYFAERTGKIHSRQNCLVMLSAQRNTSTGWRARSPACWPRTTLAAGPSSVAGACPSLRGRGSFTNTCTHPCHPCHPSMPPIHADGGFAPQSCLFPCL